MSLLNKPTLERRGVPGFGDRQARLLAVDLTPGAYGSNRTGRMFTGDALGEFLFAALYRTGFANQPVGAHRQDGLELNDLFISAVCHCASPGNKPSTEEIENCRPFLLRELALLSNLRAVVALGRIAFDQTFEIFQLKKTPSMQFSHNACYVLGDNLPALLASYHPSCQNTQTGRLTSSMFDQVWQRAKGYLDPLR